MSWIKIEHSTPDKPEVYRIARLLGISRGDAFLLLVRWWAWLDQTTSNGKVTLMYAKDCDDLMHTAGFAMSLKEVGWLEIGADGMVGVTPNFDRHNGETAKNRALSARRQSKFRDAPSRKSNATSNANSNADVTQTALPEKRREEVKTAAIASSVDPRKLMFDLGVRILTSHGSSESASRSFLASQSKHGHGGEAKLAEVLGYLAAHPKVEPKSYIAAAMKPPDKAEEMRRKLALMP